MDELLNRISRLEKKVFLGCCLTCSEFKDYMEPDGECPEEVKLYNEGHRYCNCKYEYVAPEDRCDQWEKRR